MERQSLEKERIGAEATDWFVRLQDDGSDAVVRKQFTEWLLRSPAHIEEFLAITRTWGDLAAPTNPTWSVEHLVSAARAEPEETNVFPLPLRVAPAGREQIPSSRRRLLLGIAAVAASVMLAVVAWIGVQGGFGPPRVRTATGEQRSMTLTDGSVVHLNTNSEISIELTPDERRIVLLRGEARFDVGKNAAWPFIVSTPQATVRALGTIFNVQATRGSTAVAVLEGRVEVTGRPERPEAPAGASETASTRHASVKGTASATQPAKAHPALVRLQLVAGQQAAVTPDGEVVPNGGPPLERVLAWTEQRLVFREEALIDVVTEFNRYQRRPIRVGDPQLAALRISGTFGSNDVASLLQYLVRFHGVRVENNTDGTQVLRVESGSAEPRR